MGQCTGVGAARGGREGAAGKRKVRVTVTVSLTYSRVCG